MTLYRQPANENIARFLLLLEKWLEKYDKRSNQIIITGDTNLDLLKFETHNKTSEYLDLLTAHGLLPNITKPTRIKHTSATLIDHIFSPISDAYSGILLSELSGSHGYTDHYPVFCMIEATKQPLTNPKTFTKKFFTYDGHRARREGLRTENWNDFYNEYEPNSVYTIFQDKYVDHYEKNITTKNVTVKRNKFPKAPWMTPEILRKMRRRDRLSKLSARREDYRQLRNEIVSDCRRAEKQYYHRRIQENINDTKEHWKVLKQVMGKMNNKSDLPLSFRNGDDWVTDKKTNAENINTYYSNVGPSTNRSVGTPTKPPSHYLHKFKEKNSECMADTRFTKDDVVDACMNISKKKSCDAFGLSQQIVLNDIDIIAPMITHIANCSLREGICPDLSKIARVIPVFKEKGEKYLYSNYRPISLLPVLSKILEKLMYNKIFHFLVRYQILFKSQFGFRKGNSTANATLEFLKTIETALQENECAIGVFCDLSKAFDTLNHDILLAKLDHYGIRGKWHSWLKSYLSGRKQFVDFDGIHSGYKDITVGVPQGSILGPLLFLIYINDLPGSLKELTPVMFADDTNLVIRGDNLQNMVNILNTDLETLSDFFKANQLKLNAEKTKMVCFRKKNKEFDGNDHAVSLAGTTIPFEKNALFLGVTLDEHLTWEGHCNVVANKMARNAGILNRVKNQIPFDSMKILYNSLIFPHYSYCLEAWGACQPKSSKRIKLIQKKAVRTVCKSHWLSHTEPRMKKLNLLKFDDQHEFQCLTLIFKMLKGLSPDIYQLLPTQNDNNTTSSLRSSRDQPQNLRLPSYQANQNKRTFRSLTPDLWNRLPNELKCATSQAIFKNKLKSNILLHYEDRTMCTNPICQDQRYHV